MCFLCTACRPRSQKNLSLLLDFRFRQNEFQYRRHLGKWQKCFPDPLLKRWLSRYDLDSGNLERQFRPVAIGTRPFATGEPDELDCAELESAANLLRKFARGR